MSDRKPAPPSWLDKTGKAYWKKYVSQVDTSTAHARDLLARFCDAHSTYRQAAEQVKKEGITVTNFNGAIRPHPAVGIRDKATSIINKLSGLLGLEGGKPPEDGEDELDQFQGN